MIRASGAALLVIAALWAWAVFAAPVDAMQGTIQKILYVHVPCAIGGYLGFLTTAVCSALYLRNPDERYDRAAIAAAEVGVVFCSLNIASGPIWARGTWGHWWDWDPSLTVTLLLWFIYLAYLLLRAPATSARTCTCFVPRRVWPLGCAAPSTGRRWPKR